MFNPKCPCCKKKVAWSKRTRFLSMPGVRKASPCPNCNAEIIWSKWPFRIFVIGFYLSMFIFILKLLKVEFGLLLRIIIYVSLFLVLASNFIMHFEKVSSKNE